MGPWNWWHMGGGWGWGAMIVGMLFMLLLWLFIIGLIVLFVRWIIQGGRSSSREGVPGAKSETALEILKERYARGEITREEYQNMRRDLET